MTESNITHKAGTMRIVIIGGGGLIGAKLVGLLSDDGHNAVAASPSSGVDAITGIGLAEVLSGARVLVDVMEAPSLEGSAALDFFVTATRNLLGASKSAGVGHYVALSVVGVDHVDGGYFQAKAAQENLIKASSIPHTIVRSTQFFDLMERVLQTNADGDAIRLSPVLIQPVSPDDVAETLAEVALAAPLNRTIELAGSEAICLDELARLILSAQEDPRPVIADAHASFFGSRLRRRSLMPSPNPRIGPSTVRHWLRHFITAD